MTSPGRDATGPSPASGIAATVVHRSVATGQARFVFGWRCRNIEHAARGLDRAALSILAIQREGRGGTRGELALVWDLGLQ